MDEKMNEARINAYRFILSKAMLDIKWHSQSKLEGLSQNFLKFKKQSQEIEDIANLAYCFHTLAIHLTLDMNDFEEDAFWTDLKNTTINYHQILYTDYESLFNRHLKGDDVSILDNK